MSQSPPVELTLLDVCKETDNKVRWDAFIDDAKFELYIPKWRVPTPWPKAIRVTIMPNSDDADFSASRIPHEQLSGDPSVVKTPIDAIVQKTRCQTKTVRYDPFGDPNDWEIGSPYIPYSLTHDGASRLRLSVEWIE